MWIVTDESDRCVVTVGGVREPLPDDQWREVLEGANLAATVRTILGV